MDPICYRQILLTAYTIISILGVIYTNILNVYKQIFYNYYTVLLYIDIKLKQTPACHTIMFKEWLRMNKYLSWITRALKATHFRCKVCDVTGKLSDMGSASRDSHAKRQKHKSKLDEKDNNKLLLKIKTTTK